MKTKQCNNIEVAEMSMKDLLPVGLSLAVAGVAMAYLQDVNADTKDDFGPDACAARSDAATSYNASNDLCWNGVNNTGSASPDTFNWNSTEDGATGVANVAKKMPTIALVFAAAILIGVLVRAFRV